jgi:hypothetical protein
MNKYILKAIFKDFFSSKTQLFVTTLTYYVMVTFIPCFILCNQILKLLGLSSDKSIGITLGLKEISPIVTISILLFSLTLLYCIKGKIQVQKQYFCFYFPWGFDHLFHIHFYTNIFY